MLSLIVTTPADGKSYAIEVLGVENVEIPDDADLTLVNAVLEPLDALHRAGHPMPGGLVFSAQHFTEDEERSGASAEYVPYDGQTIYINPNPLFWAPENRRIAFDELDVSTPDPRGTIYHEYAHHWVYIHSPVSHIVYCTAPPTDEALRDFGRVDSATFDDIARGVSYYARASILEFICETFAGLRTGLDYEDPRILELYNEFVKGFAPPER